MTAAEAIVPAGWAARLDIEVRRRGARSELGRRGHSGPLRLQRPFYPEGEHVVHLYVLHPPGGVVGGDGLDVALCVRAGAAALLTTPAAQKLYRSAGAESVQRVSIHAEAGAAVEWFPSETIVFDGARARSATHVELAPAATFFGWEISCLGRPASGIAYDRGRYSQSFEVWRGGSPLLVDRLRVDGGDAALAAAWGYAGLPVFGSFYAVPRDARALPALVESLRASITARASTRWAVSALEELAVVRALGTSVEDMRALFAQLWAGARPQLLDRPAVRPRVWAT